LKIAIKNEFLCIEFKNVEERKIVKAHFTFEDMSNVMSRGGFDKTKIKKVSFLRISKKYGFLFSGFLQDYLSFCRRKGLVIEEVTDLRTKLPHQLKKYDTEKFKKHFPFEYVEHETRILDKMLKVSYGICKSPTGGGKGDVIMAFVKEVKTPTLLLVNKITLAFQLKERAEKEGLSVGVWHSKEKTRGEDLQIATIGSVNSLGEFDKYKVLIVDEVHRASSNTFQTFLKNSSFPVRIGFSATPRTDNYKFALIRQFFGEIVVEVKAKELLENEVIAKPIIKFVKVKCMPTLDWQSAYDRAIINNESRNKQIIKIIEKHNEPTLILINDVKHNQGNKIKEKIEELTEKKVNFISGVYGDKNKSIQSLEDDKIDVLIATNILNEGVSIKNIKLLIIASGRKAESETLQKIGRGVRIMEGKESFKVYDFYDMGNKFTERHSQERMSIYKKEGYGNIELIDSF
jgi:superfamily II DNA or RNA helicase